MEFLSPNEWLRLFTYFLALAASSGLLFSILITPNRQRSTVYFGYFCALMMVWATATFNRTAVGHWIVNTGPFYKSGTTALMAMIIAFIVFLTYYSISDRTARRALLVVCLVDLLAAWFFLWTDQLVVMDGFDATKLYFSAYLVGGVGVAMFAYIFYHVTRGNSDKKWVRIPLLLFMVGLLSNIVHPFINFPIDAVFFTVAALWLGWVILRRQVFHPLRELNIELRRTNRQLQLALDEVAAEKAHVMNLHSDLTTAYRYKSDFLENMSHELRTPLNSIIGYSELLRSTLYGELNDQQYDRLERIYKNGTHLAGLIDSILDYNKIEKGEMRLFVAELNFDELIAEVIQQVQPEADEKGLTLRTEIASNLPAVQGDRERMIQVLHHVIDNAIKFTQSGSVDVHADVMTVTDGQADSDILPDSVTLPDGEWAIIRVMDTGIGIKTEDQQRIFEHFVQVDSSRTRDYEGIGLGLAIARKVVELHNGIMTLDSAPGEGSTFIVVLPTSQEITHHKSIAVSHNVVNNIT